MKTRLLASAVLLAAQISTLAEDRGVPRTEEAIRKDLATRICALLDEFELDEDCKLPSDFPPRTSSWTKSLRAIDELFAELQIYSTDLRNATAREIIQKVAPESLKKLDEILRKPVASDPEADERWRTFVMLHGLEAKDEALRFEILQRQQSQLEEDLRTIAALEEKFRSGMLILGQEGAYWNSDLATLARIGRVKYELPVREHFEYDDLSPAYPLGQDEGVVLSANATIRIPKLNPKGMYLSAFEFRIVTSTWFPNQKDRGAHYAVVAWPNETEIARAFVLEDGTKVLSKLVGKEAIKSRKLDLGGWEHLPIDIHLKTK